MKRSKRYTEAERKDFISQFHHSGLCASAFCRAQGISTVSLALWRKRYAAKSRRQRPARALQATAVTAPAWVPVLVRDDASSPPAPAACYVLVADAGSLQVPRGFDAREVAALWQVLSPSTLMGMGVAS